MDLFEYYKNQPKKLSKICNKYLKIQEKKGLTYKNCKKFLKKVEKIGFTFDYGLDLIPYNLRKKKKITIPETFNFKYFSNLDNNQKKRTINYLLIFKHKLENEKYKDALLMLNEYKKEVEEIKTKIKKQKVFRDPIIKSYFPLNYEEIITS